MCPWVILPLSLEDDDWGTTSKVLELHDSESCFSSMEDEEQGIGAAAAVGDFIVHTVCEPPNGKPSSSRAAAPAVCAPVAGFFLLVMCCSLYCHSCFRKLQLAQILFRSR